MNTEERKKLDRICNPRALAVFGGVGKFGSFANMILLSHLVYGYKGKIYPISNNGSEVAGLKIYKSLKEVDEPVDLVSIAVPARNVPDVLRDCLECGVTGAQVHTAGFSETGDEQGAAIEKEMERIAQRGLMIIGPNCFGIYCPRGGITLLPGFDYSKEPGPLGMISQSGGLANDFAHEAIHAGINISKVISYGNGCDLEAVKLLEYLSEDPETEYIAAYLEGVKDGRLFLETVRRVAAKKPLVIWKGGLTPLGSKAAMSHTGSLGGEAKTWEGALAQAGAISVQGLDEMMDTLTALKFLKSRGTRIALAGGGGAIGVFSSDMAYKWGLEMPPFSPETQKRLMELFPTPGNSVLNPLDTGTPVLPLNIFGAQIKEILTRESIDVLVLIMLLHSLEAVPRAICINRGFPLPKEGQYLEELLEILSPLKKETGKDIVVVMENRTYRLEDTYIEGIARKMRRKFQENGIPVYANAARALSGIRNAGRINLNVTGPPSCP